MRPTTEQIVAFARVLLADPDATAAPPSAEGAERAADAAAAAAAPTAYATVISEIVPLLSELLSGSGAQELGMENTSAVCEAASEALVELAAELRADDIGPTVLTAVLCLAHDNDVEENRVVATQLLGNLAPTIGRELCCQFVVHEIVSLADDPVFRVRKAAALKIGALCSVVGEERRWRGCCASSRCARDADPDADPDPTGAPPAFPSAPHPTTLPTLTARPPPAPRLLQGARARRDLGRAQGVGREPGRGGGGDAAPCARTSSSPSSTFHGDGSRWVRIAACQALGPFIATLPTEHISADLLTLFAQLASPNNTAVGDSDIAFYCAYNFPGVAQAVGAARWSELADAFRTLTTNLQWKVRRTLSFSLHALAAVLGRDAAEAELVGTFDHFLKDLDEVKVGVIAHIAAFLAVLSEGERRKSCRRCSRSKRRPTTGASATPSPCSSPTSAQSSTDATPSSAPSSRSRSTCAATRSRRCASPPSAKWARCSAPCSTRRAEATRRRGS